MPGIQQAAATIHTPASSIASGSDTFNRADGNINGSTMSDGVSTWSSGVNTFPNCTINGNQLRGNTGSAYNAARVSSPTMTANHSMTITLVTLNAYVGCVVRFQGSADSRGYILWTDGSTSQLRLAKWSTNGSTTTTQIALYTVTHGTGAAGVLAAGDTITLKVSGSTFTASVNGTAESVSSGTNTDSDFSTGQPGVFIFDTGVSLDTISFTDV